MKIELTHEYFFDIITEIENAISHSYSHNISQLKYELNWVSPNFLYIRFNELRYIINQIPDDDTITIAISIWNKYNDLLGVNEQNIRFREHLKLFGWT